MKTKNVSLEAMVEGHKDVYQDNYDSELLVSLQVNIRANIEMLQRFVLFHLFSE